MTRSKNIPSAEEFERASRLMEEKARGLDRVRNDVLARFQKAGELHEFFILDQRDVDFRAYVFFRASEDLKRAGQTGLDVQIADFVYDALQRVGRGGREEIEVAFEYDSHENVQTNFEGDYSLRLRG